MARQALGKGFKALISPSSLSAAGQAQNGDGVLTLDVSDIQPSPFQPRRRFAEQQIEELAASIRERGLVQPLVVRKVKGAYELIAGERRLRAVKSLGETKVKVVVHEASDQEVAELALIENLQREDLTPLEEAEQYRRLQIRFGMKQETIDKHVGKARTVVANMIRLLELEKEVRDALERSEITVGHAKVLLQIKDRDQQIQATQKVIKSSLTVRQTEQLVRALLNPAPKPPATAEQQPLPAPYEEVCRKLSKGWGANVHISLKGKNNGVIEIPYSGREELERLLHLFGVDASL